MVELQAVSAEGHHDSPYRYDLAPLGWASGLALSLDETGGPR